MYHPRDRFEASYRQIVPCSAKPTHELTQPSLVKYLLVKVVAAMDDDQGERSQNNCSTPARNLRGTKRSRGALPKNRRSRWDLP